MEFLTGILAEALDIWEKGGVLMVPLALLAAFLYFTGFQVYFHFDRGNYLKVPLPQIEKWVESPDEAEGELAEIIHYTQADLESMHDLRVRFSEVRSAHLPPINRRIVFISVLVSVAPLMGLLGTVMGMLVTFSGLTMRVGRTIDLIASGISEALITTQTGLVIAIPGYVLIYMIMRRRTMLETVLQRMESQSMQKFEKQLRENAA